MPDEPKPHEKGMFRVGGVEVLVYEDGSVLIIRRDSHERVELGRYEADILLRTLEAMR